MTLNYLIFEAQLERSTSLVAIKPLLKNFRTLEQDCVCIETVGHWIRGTLLFVAADNVAAHGLAGFVQCFRAELNMRRKARHELHVQNVVRGENSNHFGVPSECALSKALQNFHPTTGFPPDILHNLFKGIVPVELGLCVCVITDRGLKAVFLDFKLRPKHHHVEHYSVFWASC